MSLTDVGAMLWFGKLRTVDSGMSCDRTLARAFRRGDLAAIHEYLLVDVRPTLMLMTAGDDALSQLGVDPRFRRTYLAVRRIEQSEKESGNGGVAIGLFVRRDLVADSAGVAKLVELFEVP